MALKFSLSITLSDDRAKAATDVTEALMGLAAMFSRRGFRAEERGVVRSLDTGNTIGMFELDEVSE